LPVIAINNGGTAVVAWLNGGSTQVSSAVRPGPTGNFGDIKTISVAGDPIAGLRVAVGDAGNAAAIWSRTGPTNSFIEVAERPAGGTFPNMGTSISSTVTGNETDPTVVIDPSGRPTALWSAVTLGVVEFAERAPGDTNWSAFAQASQVGDSATSPAAGVAPSGMVVAAWEVGTPGGGLIKAAIRPPGGGGFADFRELSGPSMNTLAPLVAVGRGGDALIAWGSSMGEAIYAVRRAANGAYGPLLQAVSNQIQLPGEFVNFQQPSIGVDDQGNGIATFLQDTFRNPTNFYRFRAVSFDAAAPSLSASVPASGTAGRAVAMAAAAVDRLTPVSINWAFGDGGTATGGAVSHVFGARGAFTVTVTATDGVGNATTTTRPVLVAAAPAKRISSPVRVAWGVSKKRLFLLRMSVTRVPKGAKAELRCARRKSGKKCPFKRRSSKRIRKRSITLFKQVRVSKVAGKKNRTFRAGQRLVLRITAPGYVGKGVRYDLRKSKIPSGKTFCMRVGSKKLRKRC
jgi:chitodextrinase